MKKTTENWEEEIANLIYNNCKIGGCGQCEEELEKTVVIVQSLIDKAKEETAKEYIDALIWCSGSEDFQLEGKAREGWEKLCMPLISKYK